VYRPEDQGFLSWVLDTFGGGNADKQDSLDAAIPEGADVIRSRKQSPISRLASILPDAIEDPLREGVRNLRQPWTAARNRYRSNESTSLPTKFAVDAISAGISNPLEALEPGGGGAASAAVSALGKAPTPKSVESAIELLHSSDPDILRLQDILSGNYGQKARNNALDQLGGEQQARLVVERSRNPEVVKDVVEEFGGSDVIYRGGGVEPFIDPSKADGTPVARRVERYSAIAPEYRDEWSQILDPYLSEKQGFYDYVQREGNPDGLSEDELIDRILTEDWDAGTLYEGLREKANALMDFIGQGKAESLAQQRLVNKERPVAVFGANLDRVGRYYLKRANEDHTARVMPYVVDQGRSLAIDGGGARWTNIPAQNLGAALAREGVPVSEVKDAVQSMPDWNKPSIQGVDPEYGVMMDEASLMQPGSFLGNILTGYNSGKPAIVSPGREAGFLRLANAENIRSERLEEFGRLGHLLGYPTTIVNRVQDGAGIKSRVTQTFGEERLRHLQALFDPTAKGKPGIWR